MTYSKPTGTQTHRSHPTTPPITILSNRCNNPIFVVALQLRHQSSERRNCCLYAGEHLFGSMQMNADLSRYLWTRMTVSSFQLGSKSNAVFHKQL